MTTEIALMNSSGVALAADSTLTVKNGNGKLHYPGVDKIFGLSAYDPVGIMLYGRSDFLGIPWEVVIKFYRDKYASQQDTLEAYATRFFTFMEEFCCSHFNEDGPQQALFDYGLELCSKLDKVVQRYISSKAKKINIGQMSAEEANNSLHELGRDYKQYLIRQLDKTIERIQKMEKVFSNDGKKFNDFGKSIEAKLEKIFPDIYCGVFERIILDEETIGKIKNYIVAAASRRVVSCFSSGLVFAGYGQNEIFPSMFWFEIDTFLDGILVYRKAGEKRITFTNRAEFMSFGNTDAVNSVVSGISAEFRKDFGDSVEAEFQEGIGGVEAKHIIDVARKKFDDIADHVEERFKERILSTVALLPKQTLAEIAANLIMLSSTMSQVSEVDGSVGGPVSSAVISRGDGMIWIHRQHYFDAENNPHYMSRYENRRKPPYSNRKAGVDK